MITSRPFWFRVRSTSTFKWPWIVSLASTAGLLVGSALVGGQPRIPQKTGLERSEVSLTGKSDQTQRDHRIREGTEIIDSTGYFRMTGDRVTFFTDDGSGRYVALENLNLERVSRAIADNPEPLQWTVTGTITEYRGANYLFVRRAALKTEAPTPADIF